MEPTRHLGGFIRAISNAMSQSMQQNAEAAGLTTTQCMFLHHLWFRQEIQGKATYARDLEQFFDVKHPTVSGILRRMESAGYVTFEADAEDHRCKAIRLTPRAVRAHSAIESHIQSEEDRLVAHMTPAEVQEFRRLLRQAADNLGVCAPHHPEKEEANL